MSVRQGDVPVCAHFGHVSQEKGSNYLVSRSGVSFMYGVTLPLFGSHIGASRILFSIFIYLLCGIIFPFQK